MNADLLLQHYEQISDASDAVKRLRRFVLELAVQGKLVEQDNDEKPESSLPSGNNQLSSSELPRNWREFNVGAVLEFTYGKGLPKKERLEAGPIPVYGSNGVIGYTQEPLVEEQSIIVGRKGSAGAINICDGPSWTTDVAYYVVAPAFFSIRYLEIALSALKLDSLGKGVKPGLSRSDAYNLTLAIPPLAEQHRIVAKVDELMAFCDRLEEARDSREATRNKLTTASLARLTDADSTEEGFRDSARFALGALSSITHRQDQIKGIRQAIFDLAVRGKLVEQNPNDEPASALLERVSEEVERLNSGGRNAKSKATNQNSEEFPFELPRGWAWTTFPKVGKFGRGKSKHRPRNDPKLFSDGIYPMVQTGDVARSQGRVNTFSAKYNDYGLQQSMVWPSGTLCITIAANIADSGILQFDACFPDSVVGLVPASEFESAVYFEFFVRTAKSNLLEFAPATAQKNINLGILEAVKIPLPPLAEQKRIVAKVDELMGICDQLEASLSGAEAKRARLLEATLREALEPAQGALVAAE